MKKAVCVAAGLFVAFLCFASVSSAGPIIDQILKKKELVVGTSATYPPLTFKAKNGKPYGLDIDLAGAIAAEMGVKLRVEIIPFDELIAALENGKIDMIISCMTITARRNLRVAYVGPYFISGQSILTTKDVAININGPDDVNKPDFSIAVPRGTTTELIAGKLLPKAKIVVVKSNDEALGLLLKKKVKALMSDYPFVTVEALRYKDKGLLSNPPFSMEPLGIAVREGDPLLVNFLGNFINTLRSNGIINILAQRWFADASWMADLP